ncbi:amino acid adenylation domain-containing protein [Chryseobacterium sp. B21-037]|uniref:amino acid adenylation domain-containing protein n=1 Tax=Chryseobacterium sp. B21-037 TaxID=2926038 RepID=UPI002358C29C|nr:amino acid adenylation domain-containing protein [Chryseobacterium sp. B21-037]MDC8104560.1 amino acid adenylation domain-containing protein [Chryseobacterium sp. B21-037]
MKLTLPQLDVFFEQLLYPDTPIYNIGAKIEIKGEIQIETFKKAYREMINQHDAYRSFFRQSEDEVKKHIKEEEPRHLEWIDFSNETDAVSSAEHFMEREFLIPFNVLEDDCLYRFVLIKCSNVHYYLFSVYHHIITDGWGTSLMFQRLIKNYNDILKFDMVQDQYPYEYSTFVTHDLAYQDSDEFYKDKQYWAERYSTLPPVVFNRKDNKEYAVHESDRKELIVRREDYNKLIELGKKHNFSTFHGFLGLFFLYFGRINQSDDLAIGIPVLNRNTKVFKKTVGLFMGVSPLRMRLDYQANLLDLINSTKKQLMSDYRHQRYPLGKIVSDLKLFNEKNKLFNITLSYEKHNYADHFEGTQTTVIPLTNKSERSALALFVREFDDNEDIKIDFDYNTDYFDDQSIEQCVRHIHYMIVNIETLAAEPLYKISFLSEEEKESLFLFNERFSSKDENQDHNKTFLDLFNEKTLEFPDKVAIADENFSLSYTETNKISTQIADYLLHHHNDEKTVAVLLNRSAYMICVLLGIMKAGKAYIPLDPEFPVQRLQYILQDSKAQLLISEENISLNLTDIESILVSDIVNKSLCNKEVYVTPTDTAYIIYTSGSTGNPKGVEIGHASLLNLLESISEKPGIDDQDTMYSVTTYSFDISILEFFTPLINGATLYIASEKTLRDPVATIQEIVEVKPSVIQATPSFFKRLLSVGWEPDSELKIMCGGDLINNDLIEELLASCKELWNMYGPTETTIWSSTKKIESGTLPQNIGQPIKETSFYILDTDLNLLPVNTVGDIYIGGKGIAKGYYNNEDLSLERFIKNPFRKEELMYKTGDVGKWNEQGEILFFGRSDNQVKVKGYRIELGDIENHLNTVENIEDSVVVAKEVEGENQLIAYLKTHAPIEISSLYEKLHEKLPYYMVPQFIFPIEEFPLTPNQKIDRKSLSMKDFPSEEPATIQIIKDAEMMQELKDVWREILNYKKDIEDKDNFFELGGHSLLISRLVNVLNKKFSVHLTMKDVFENPDLSSLCHTILKKNDRNSLILKAPDQDLYLATPTQKNIWLACQRKEVSPSYNMLMEFDVAGTINVVTFEKAVRQIISASEIVRTNFILEDEAVIQKIHSSEDIHFALEINEVANESGYRKAIDDYKGYCFDLEKELLLKMMILKVRGKYKVIFLVHHIIFDGISTGIFIKQLISLYNNHSNQTAELRPEIQFRDYSNWYYQNADLEKNDIFWKNYTKGYPYEAFVKKETVTADSYQGNIFTIPLDLEVTQGLSDLAKKMKTTPYLLMLTSLLIFLRNISGKTDICIATIDSGRSVPQVQSLLGVFIKSLLVRVTFGEEELGEVLHKVTQEFLKVTKYEEVSDHSFVKNNIDILFVTQDPELSYNTISDFADFSLQNVSQDTTYNKFPLIMNIINEPQGIQLEISYNKSLYKEHIIADFSQAYTDFVKYLSTLRSEAELGYKDFFHSNNPVDIDFDF